MAVELEHIESGVNTQYISPKGDFITFRDDAHYEEKVREWGLSTTKVIKKEFWYKTSDYKRIVTIKGYEVYGKTQEYNTLVIEFQDGELSCIFPDYLKDMQKPNFGKESINSEEGNEGEVKVEVKLKTEKPKTEAKPKEKEVSNKKDSQRTEDKKDKIPAIELPTDKVHFSAEVKQFALSYNPFADRNDTIVLLDNLKIEGEELVEIGLAWCGFSKTIEKHELKPGEMIEFDGKIVKKTAPKGKEADDVEDSSLLLTDSIVYKVNNPSKIVKNK